MNYEFTHTIGTHLRKELAFKRMVPIRQAQGKRFMNYKFKKKTVSPLFSTKSIIALHELLE